MSKERRRLRRQQQPGRRTEDQSLSKPRIRSAAVALRPHHRRGHQENTTSSAPGGNNCLPQLPMERVSGRGRQRFGPASTPANARRNQDQTAFHLPRPQHWKHNKLSWKLFANPHKHAKRPAAFGTPNSEGRRRFVGASPQRPPREQSGVGSGGDNRRVVKPRADCFRSPGFRAPPSRCGRVTPEADKRTTQRRRRRQQPPDRRTKGRSLSEPRVPSAASLCRRVTAEASREHNGVGPDLVPSPFAPTPGETKSTPPSAFRTPRRWKRKKLSRRLFAKRHGEARAPVAFGTPNSECRRLLAGVSPRRRRQQPRGRQTEDQSLSESVPPTSARAANGPEAR